MGFKLERANRDEYEEELRRALGSVEGHLYPAEAFRLFEYASELPDKSLVIEIGHFRGRSTIALALGVKKIKGKVFTFDPHAYYVDHPPGVDESYFGQVYNVDDIEPFLTNVVKYGVADTVIPIIDSSERLISYKFPVDGPITMAFIDGHHGKESVQRDASACSILLEVGGVMALHDSDWPSIRDVVEFYQHMKWFEIFDRVNSTTFMRKVKSR